MGSVARSVGGFISNTFGSVMKVLAPKIPDFPIGPFNPPPAEPAAPGGPGAKAEESSEAQAERLRVLAAARRKKTQTLLTSAQGVQDFAGAVKKRLLGE